MPQSPYHHPPLQRRRAVSVCTATLMRGTPCWLRYDAWYEKLARSFRRSLSKRKRQTPSRRRAYLHRDAVLTSIATPCLPYIIKQRESVVPQAESGPKPAIPGAYLHRHLVPRGKIGARHAPRHGLKFSANTFLAACAHHPF